MSCKCRVEFFGLLAAFREIDLLVPGLLVPECIRSLLVPGLVVPECIRIQSNTVRFTYTLL